MSSSQSSDHSPGEEAYYTAEEDRSCYAQSSSEASPIVPTTPNRSVYATANQTPTASPDLNRGTASAFPMVAQDQGQSEALRPIEGSLEEGRKIAPSDATVAPREPLLTHRAGASTYLGRQRAFLLRLSRSGESQKEKDAPDSPTAEAHDKPSHLRASGSRPCVNDSPPTDLADPLKKKYTARRETSDLSYVYRPTPIDVDPQHQTSSSLPSSPSSNLTTSPPVSNRTTDSHQGPDPIEEEDEMPYDRFGNFTMNPLAPVFVPRQGGQPSRGGQPVQGGWPGATRVRNPHGWMDYGVGQPSAGRVPAAPTSNPPTPDRVPLFGAAHGLFYEPRTALFTGDGPPRTTPHRPDGTLPSQPDPHSDFLTNRQLPPPSHRAQEDQLHIQPSREYVARMANFGRNGPVQRFRIARPAPAAQGQGQGQGVEMEMMAQQQQQGSRVLVQREFQAGNGGELEEEDEEDEDDDDEETVVDEGNEGRWYVGPSP